MTRLRQAIRQNVPRVLTPADIFGANLKQWVRADDVAPGAVAAWNDRSGNANNFAQATAGKRPIASAAGGPNSKPEVTFDGVDDFVENLTLNFPAPPFYVSLVMKQITWVIGATSWSTEFDFVAATGINTLVATPTISMRNGADANSNNGATVGQYKLVEAQFTNSAADYLRAGASTVTGANAGAHDPAATGDLLGAGSLGGTPANVSICEFLAVFANVSSVQRAQYAAYIAKRYGAGVLT